MYRTEPDPGLAGQRDHWPRGKVLGGSSSINAMVYIRGHREDYEDWKALGNPGWGWDDVLPAYRAMEDNEAGGDAWRGTGGPLFISANRRDLHPLVKDYIAACVAAGLPVQRRFQRGRAGGRGQLPADGEGRAAQFGSARLPAPGDEAAECRGDDRRAGDARDDRGAARGGGGVSSAAGGARCIRARRRGDPVGRRDQLAAAVAAFGHRAGGAVAGAWASPCCTTIRMSATI